MPAEEEGLEIERGGISRVAYQIYADADERGVLDGEALHDEIAAPDHPLHALFEWDDAVAGRAHRVNQIDRHIRKAYLRIWHDDQPVRVRSFVPVRYTGDTERLKGYTAVEKVVSNPMHYRYLMRELRRDIARMKNKYGHLEEFARLLREALGDADGQSA